MYIYISELFCTMMTCKCLFPTSFSLPLYYMRPKRERNKKKIHFSLSFFFLVGVVDVVLFIIFFFLYLTTCTPDTRTSAYTAKVHLFCAYSHVSITYDMSLERQIHTDLIIDTFTFSIYIAMAGIYFCHMLLLPFFIDAMANRYLESNKR